MKYRKKPIVIDAEQFYLIENASDMSSPVGSVNSVEKDPWWKWWGTGWSIKTLEGRHEVIEGDWIITGVKGEKYPCKADIFEMTYEKIED